MSFTSTLSEEKENGEHLYPRHKALSPDGRYAGSSTSSGRGSPARGFRGVYGAREDGSETSSGIARERPTSSLPQPGGSGNGQESWKRAAEVTSQLKARIEQMKVSPSFLISLVAGWPVLIILMTDMAYRPNKDFLDLEVQYAV